MRACELDGAWGGDQSFEVLKRGGLHLVVTKVVPVGRGADKRKKRKKRVGWGGRRESSCAAQ